MTRNAVSKGPRCEPPPSPEGSTGSTLRCENPKASERRTSFDATQVRQAEKEVIASEFAARAFREYVTDVAAEAFDLIYGGSEPIDAALDAMDVANNDWRQDEFAEGVLDQLSTERLLREAVEATNRDMLEMDRAAFEADMNLRCTEPTPDGSFSLETWMFR